MTTLSIVIPAFNEEDGIIDIMQRILAIGPNLAEEGVADLELIVVDDGSSDRTAELAATIADVRLIRRARNGGYGAALKTGFAAARGDWIGFMDADGTYPPEYYPQLYRVALAENADIVIGSRMAGADSQMPRVRWLGNLMFARLVSLISAERITDSASGQRIFKKEILARLYPLPDGLNLTPVMSTRALHEKLKMVEVPIPYSERAGRSKLSVAHDGIRFAQSIVWTALHYNPVRPLGLVGLFCLITACVIGFGLIGVRISGTNSVSPLGAFTLFAAMVLGVAGVSILALGVSFNYFVALFHRSPVRQGLWGRPIFRKRLDRHFGWAGVAFFALGFGLSIISLVLGIRGWEVSRLWIYYLASASFSMMGIQFTIAWVQMQVLDTLRIRHELVAEDMLGKEHAQSNSYLARKVTPVIVK